MYETFVHIVNMQVFNFNVFGGFIIEEVIPNKRKIKTSVHIGEKDMEEFIL